MTLAVNIAQSGSNNQTFRNGIIKGAMTIDQRNNGAVVGADPAGTNFVVDRFLSYSEGKNITSFQQTGTVATAPVGFSRFITATTLATTPTPDQGPWVKQRIEGFNVADFGFGTANAQPITLSFLVRSSVTGTFSGSIGNTEGAGPVYYPFNYTISAANTWEYKTITIPGATTGTWAVNNAVGMILTFSLGAGSAWQRPVNSWTNNVALSSTTASNAFLTTVGATWQITGVQLEEGTAASPFEYRLYGTELALCQRYYEQSAQGNDFIWTGYGSNGSGYYLSIPFKVEKRATPTVTVSTPGTSAFNAASLTATDINVDKFNAVCTANATAVAGFFYVRFRATSEL